MNSPIADGAKRGAGIAHAVAPTVPRWRGLGRRGSGVLARHAGRCPMPAAGAGHRLPGGAAPYWRPPVPSMRQSWVASAGPASGLYQLMSMMRDEVT